MNTFMTFYIIYSRNPNDPRFEWKGPSFGGFKPQNRGQTRSRLIYIYNNGYQKAPKKLLTSLYDFTLSRCPNALEFFSPSVAFLGGIRCLKIQLKKHRWRTSSIWLNIIIIIIIIIIIQKILCQILSYPVFPPISHPIGSIYGTFTGLHPAFKKQNPDPSM